MDRNDDLGGESLNQLAIKKRNHGSTSSRIERTFRKCKPALAVALFVLAFFARGSHALQVAEDIAILDPYFYRVPVFDPIEGSKETVVAYYEMSGDELVPVPAKENTPEGKARIREESLRRGRELLGTIKPFVIRDSHQVITALRLTDSSPELSCLLLLPEFENWYANLLGPRCLAAAPNRRTIFLFPRSGSSIREFGNEVLSYFHNDPWPISAELFDLRAGNPKSIHKFEVD